MKKIIAVLGTGILFAGLMISCTSTSKESVPAHSAVDESGSVSVSGNGFEK